MLYARTYRPHARLWAPQIPAGGPVDALTDWNNRKGGASVTFSSDFSGAADFTLASVNGGTGRVWAPSMNATQLAQVYKDTTDGITNGCCLRIDKPAAENDFANGAGQEWLFPLSSAFSSNADSFGLGVPFWTQFRFKIPANRLTLSSITSGGQAGWKWFLWGQYSPSNTAGQSFAHSLAQLVLQDTNQLGIPQAYYSDIAGNSQPFTEISAGGVNYTAQNVIDRGSGAHADRYCEVPSPWTTASPGCERFPTDEWVTFQIRIKPNTYSGTGATGNEFDMWMARAGVYTWTHLLSFRDFELGDPNSNGGGFTGLNGGHFSTFETGRVSGQATHHKWDQVIVSLADIPIPLDSGIGSSAPGYLSSLATFEAYAATTVANGKPHWRDAAAAEWQADPSISNGSAGITDHLRQIVDFSGGWGNPGARKFGRWGGGHNGSAYNGMPEFDCSGTSQPGGWTIVPGSASTVANVTPNTPTGYADGKPPASQSYDNIWPDYDNGDVTRTLGFAFGNAFSVTPRTWRFNTTSGSLFTGADHPNTNDAAGNSCYDQTAKKAIQEYQGHNPHFYRRATDTWVECTDADPTPGPNLELGSFYDASRSKWIILGGATSTPYVTRRSIATINWAAESITWSQFTASGDSCPLLTDYGVGGFHDTVLDCYWLFGGRYTAFDHIYRVNPTTWAITAHQLKDAGGSNYTIPEPTSGSVWFGIYKGFCAMVDWRILAVCLGHNQPVHFIKLPST